MGVRDFLHLGEGLDCPPLDGEKVTTHFNQKPTKNLATKKRKEKDSQLVKSNACGA